MPGRDEARVYVVDDDAAVRSALSSLIRSVGLQVQVFSDADDFLAAFAPGGVACVVADVRMPGMSGLDLQDALTARGLPVPVIVLTGYADVPMAIRAMKAGAIDFIEKPFNDQTLLDAIQRAVRQAADTCAAAEERAAVEARRARLSERERRVMDLMVEGATNRQIAERMHLSVRTVESHRARVMEKMHAQTLAELVRLTLRGEEPPAAQ